MKHHIQEVIPVIDLFAGPGGLSEGFWTFRSEDKNPFRICLSIEKDSYAHRTLELRSFFRQFSVGQIPDEYYAYLRKEITRDELFNSYRSEAAAAKREAWCAELGSSGFPVEKVDARIEKALNGSKKWVLIGGPPCQAYSIAGRSRNKGKKGYIPEKDARHFLYREYLRIIARHRPSIFVMENVKGLLSAKVNGGRIFDHILDDLHDPLAAVENIKHEALRYRIYSLVKPAYFPCDNTRSGFTPSDYLIMSENYGIPQARHRLILLGVREDAGDVLPGILVPKDRVNASTVLDGLPKLRSGLSREKDTPEKWKQRILDIVEIKDERGKDVWDRIGMALSELDVAREYGRGGEFVPLNAGCGYNEWYYDPRLKGVCNHTTKTHMPSDLHRYLFASCFAAVHEKSPTLSEFPKKLWPEHKSAQKAGRYSNFSDRFRVQIATKPSTTVMSHISKDGHYYIHYDPAQCRSLTVREAARLQTFPDNYFFEGARTQQYIQVGNAVPPLLALQLAEIVFDLLKRWDHDLKNG
ncbi:MAG: DNA cytosine methyltransferase [Smithellaceae bacterium]|nr:DNA cytosine methyltransferase [Smithellaceae bacterium]